MSTVPKEAPKEQSDAEAKDVPKDEAGSESAEAEEEEEEEVECGFCLFMKSGGCRDAFIDWENCVQEAENNKEDLVQKCAQVTLLLKDCMNAHSDYYEPILRAEKVAEEQAIIELEKENQNSLPNQDQPLPHSNQDHK